ncbi:MAG: DUF169 domain-containing protein [Deltaproteobacteria bacterium]|nr:DUF169 domain-containing protein [Deltaproteobacteria bacterium]
MEFAYIFALKKQTLVIDLEEGGFDHGERYAKTPALVEDFVDNLPIMDIPHEYVVFKPIRISPCGSGLKRHLRKGGPEVDAQRRCHDLCNAVQPLWGNGEKCARQFF